MCRFHTIPVSYFSHNILMAFNLAKIAFFVGFRDFNLVWVWESRCKISAREGRRQHTILPNFSQNCMKSRKCCCLSPPLGPLICKGKRTKWFKTDTCCRSIWSNWFIGSPTITVSLKDFFLLPFRAHRMFIYLQHRVRRCPDHPNITPPTHHL